MIARNFDEAFSQVQGLVRDFQRDEAQFLAPAYNETAVREVFINRFWMALGWDVTHETQKNPHACEVSVEKNVNVEGRGKRADYSFAVAPNYRDVRFFVEAKKPSRQLDNAQDYFQTIRYGWHARTPLAVLMDFEQFRVLDCRYKPDIDMVLQYGALEKFHYTEYADEEKFRRLYHLFSREDVGRGALEEYVAGLPKPGRRGGGVQGALFARGAYQSIDESFLQDLDGYREQLARAFKQGNAQLDGAQLTEATQRTLDRLVFMRFLEDKLIETDELVERFAGSRAPWAEFVAASRRLDRTYNGIIFKEHALLDAPAFRVDERAFASICENLSHTRSPYDFNLIPIHILGSIYERFLGKTIVVDAQGATVVPKPEVRKADGVYYTPEYIVRYIVAETVGKLIAGKTPEEIRPLRFADISCGSGSFLLGVFDLLLIFHAGYYNRNKRTRAEGVKAGCTWTDEGTLRLSLLQKRTILLNNVYGVDVDAQAVEVAQLSLYLKLLEEETTATARSYQQSLPGGLLPNLSNDNIKSGNSLIDFDILSGHLFEPEAERKLNPMNFAQEFPHVMRDGGFDAIVGNPPYLNIDDTWGKGDIRQKYVKKNYSAIYNDKTDILFYFFAKAVQLCKGEIGFIVSRAFLEGYKADKLRAWLAHNTDIRQVVDFRNYYVFKGIGITTAIVILTKSEQLEKASFYQLDSEGNVSEELAAITKGSEAFKLVSVDQKLIGSTLWSFADREIESLKKKVDAQGQPLKKILSIGQGMQTGRNEVFGELSIEQIKHFGLKEGQYFIRARNSDILSFHIVDSGEFLLYLEDVKHFDELPPELQVYLKSHEAELKERAAYKRGDCEWWKYTWPLHKEDMHHAKILCPYLATNNRFAVDNQHKYLGLTDTTILYDNNQPESLHYLLGLLNSRLLNFRFRFIGKLKGGGILEYFWNSISKLPIRCINFSNPADKARHERMMALVEGMLAAKRQLADAGTEAERNLYERKCAAIDAQIDALVYELYTLTPPEIALVEAV